MKVIFSLCLLLSIYISNCIADTAYGIWNFNSTYSAVGVIDLPQHTANVKFLLENTQHIYPGNQFSTYNRKTQTVSFLTNSTIGNLIVLNTLSVDTWELASTSIKFPFPMFPLSIESSQTTNSNDLFIVMTLVNSLNNFIVASITPNGAYTTYDTIQGYTFASASFDQQNNVFVVMMVSQSGAYIVNCYSTTGAKISSDTYTVTNFAPGYSSIGAPSNLVYLSMFSSFYFNLDIVNGNSNNGIPQLFQLYAPSKAFSLLPVISNSCNSNLNGIVQALDSDGNDVMYQFFSCPGRSVQQKISIVGPTNLGVYTTPVSIINAWNMNY